MKKIGVVLGVFFFLLSCTDKSSKIEPVLRFVLQPDFDKGLVELALKDLIRLRSRLAETKVDVQKLTLQGTDILISSKIDPRETKIQALLKNEFHDWQARVSPEKMLLSLTPAVKSAYRIQFMQLTMEILHNRLKNYGYPEYFIQPVGIGNQQKILLTMAANGDIAVERMRRLITLPGKIEFREVLAGPAASGEQIIEQYPDGLLPEWQILKTDPRTSEPVQFYLLHRIPVVDGQNIKTALRTRDSYGAPAIEIDFNSRGAKALRAYSARHIGQPMAIVFNRQIHSAPVIESVISDRVQIKGRFTPDEADDLVTLLKSSSLPVPVIFLEEKILRGVLDFEQGIIAEITFLTSFSLDKLQDLLEKGGITPVYLQQNLYGTSNQAQGDFFIINLPLSTYWTEGMGEDKKKGWQVKPKLGQIFYSPEEKRYLSTGRIDLNNCSEAKLQILMVSLGVSETEASEAVKKIMHLKYSRPNGLIPDLVALTKLNLSQKIQQVLADKTFIGGFSILSFDLLGPPVGD